MEASLLGRFVALVGVATLATALAVALIVPGALLVAGAGEYQRSHAAEHFRELAQRSVIYDTAGTVIGQVGSEDRQYVRLGQVPELLQDAVVAVEDESFWDNAGIDVNGLIRAARENFESGAVEQGGSTITQQLVKNRLLTPKRDIERKVREIVLALQLAERYPKREILEQYLNTVYFGQGAYGVQSASERFFLHPGPYGLAVPTPLAELTIGQSALLAGLIANPEGNNPFFQPERAATRRTFALSRMVDQKVITQAEADAAALEPLPTILPTADLRPRNAWAEEVQDSIISDRRFKALGETRKERERRILTGGLHIDATLDPVLQEKAQTAMNATLPTNKPGFTGALVAMDPKTGHVKAMVAGPGFEESQYNIATSYPGRQAGSTWKTITLAAALESGFSPNDRVSGASPCAFGALGKTQNAEGGGGTMTLRGATVNSVNCAYARTELAVGFPKVIETAHKMGIKQGTLAPVLTLTLGAIESTPLEMATVASTIANGGVRNDPLFVSKVTAYDGEVLFDSSKLDGVRAISADTAACETNIMAEGVARGTGTAARLDDHTAAGKTGTTDEKTDANFLGFVPQLAAFIWHGNKEARVPGAGFGGQIPARIFKAFMDSALEGQPAEPFPAPGPMCDREGSTITEAGRGVKPVPNATGGTTPTTVLTPATTPPTLPRRSVNTSPPIVTLPPTLPPTTEPPTTVSTAPPQGGGG
jgi:penicillin-binding protein 1A